ncbi:hypothetical protein BGS_0826 [Beggiatoa sp. SS]|nr:hypothetical protein BGS_0826 [Beggiatoa sp. SS]
MYVNHHRIYKTLRERGFDKENIRYLNYKSVNAANEEILNKVMVNQTTETILVKQPTITEIEDAFTDLQSKIKDNPAPLYVIMIDHGGYEGTFHIYSDKNDTSDDNTIKPDKLAGWLNDLETYLETNNINALKKPRIVILGFCYSGSFISGLSQKATFTDPKDSKTLENAGRIIITSATAQEESYKGPTEADGIPSGEYFMEEFFARLGKSDNLKQAFKFATEKTEAFTRKGGDANTTNRFYDTAMQHPLLDDKGEGKGSNILTSDEGQQAQQVFLGVGPTYKTNFAGNPAEILSVSNTFYLSH